MRPAPEAVDAGEVVSTQPERPSLSVSLINMFASKMYPDGIM